MEPDHNAEIAAAAKAVLAPLGCARKGRSRTWLADHGWWLVIVEFQPSVWSPGSYLNVSPLYLWKPAFEVPTWTFDAPIGSRPWHATVAGESFMGKAVELASLARDGLISLREQHRTIAQAAEWLQSQWRRPTAWQSYHLGMAFGLSGLAERGQRHFRRAVDPLTTDDRAAALSRECDACAAIIEDRSAFKKTVFERVQATRNALKLPPIGVLEV